MKTKNKTDFNGTWAAMASPDYWLFPHEMSDWNPEVGYNHSESMAEMSYYSRPKSLRLGSRTFLVRVNALGQGVMTPQ